MNVIDILLLLIVALAMWAGWAKGFILGVTDLAIWLGSLLAGFLLYKAISLLLQKIFPALGVWTFPLAFLSVTMQFQLLLSYALHRLIKQTPREAHSAPMNRAFGLIPGLLNGFVYAAIAAALLLSTPVFNGLAKEAHQSRIVNKLGLQVAWLDEKFSPIFGEAAKATVNSIAAKPAAESEETVELNYTVKDAKARADLEAEMLALVNGERTKRGIAPLRLDEGLVQVARQHSTDMFARGYFSHYTPESKDPFDRMKAAGISFRTAGENLALGRTLKICHEGLMNSPGHKANILNPSFGRLGIGILDGGIYGLMISQEFRN